MNHPITNAVGEQIPNLLPFLGAARGVEAIGQLSALQKAAMLAAANAGIGAVTTPGHVEDRTGAAIGTGVGSLLGSGATSLPEADAAVKKYLAIRHGEILAGKDVPISFGDFVKHLQNENNWSNRDVLYYMNKSDRVPTNHPYNRPLWSPGFENNPMYNAYAHTIKAKHAEVFGLPAGDPNYVRATHDYLDHLPSGLDVKVDVDGVNAIMIPICIHKVNLLLLSKIQMVLLEVLLRLGIKIIFLSKRVSLERHPNN